MEGDVTDQPNPMEAEGAKVWREQQILQRLRDNAKRDVDHLFAEMDVPPGTWTLSDVQTAVSSLLEQGLIEQVIPKPLGAWSGIEVRYELPTEYVISAAGKDELAR
jgi:hypothetical protein